MRYKTTTYGMDMDKIVEYVNTSEEIRGIFEKHGYPMEWMHEDDINEIIQTIGAGYKYESRYPSQYKATIIEQA